MMRARRKQAMVSGVYFQSLPAGLCKGQGTGAAEQTLVSAAALGLVTAHAEGRSVVARTWSGQGACWTTFWKFQDSSQCLARTGRHLLRHCAASRTRRVPPVRPQLLRCHPFIYPSGCRRHAISWATSELDVQAQTENRHRAAIRGCRLERGRAESPASR